MGQLEATQIDTNTKLANVEMTVAHIDKSLVALLRRFDEMHANINGGRDEGAEDNPSSVASSSITQSTAATIKSDDPAWKHCYCPDLKKKHSLKCNYCDKLINAGITRVKYHLANIGGFNVSKCKKVPTPVKEDMVALLTKNCDAKEKKRKEKQRERDEIDLDNSGGDNSSEEESEHGNDVIVLKSTKGGSSSRLATTGGTIDKFYKPESIEESVQKNKRGLSTSQKIQTQLTTQKREERRDRACEYICQFFYEAGIAHNTVTLPSFAHMVEAIGAFGRANVLRRMDSDVPAMGFLHGCMLEAKKEIAMRFDNNENSFKVAWDIIDKRWDNKLKTPLHLAGYYLNPYFYYPNKSEIELDGSFRAAVIACITKTVEDEETQDNIIEELNVYQEQQGTFGHDIAVRQRRNKNFNPAKWWLNHGTSTPNLRLLATRILNLTCSSSGCERNWSDFEQVHTKKRNKLLHDRMRDLVFIKYNSRLRQKRENKSKDPLEREMNDVLEDDANEFITGLVPNANSDKDEEHGGAQVGETIHESQLSQPQPKRKRLVRPRKKKIRSLHSLLYGGLENEAVASSSESEDNGDGDISMHQYSDSDDLGDE
ncbi:hAT transposon superfamily protein [Zea mays]|uniref:HAT transposon superfamily protein n=1 Tax=Zea mays TaxID=4577 RepID=A0A1D6EEP3_MAIZE|nr:hAT transposon superfamily protein [Zea mays]